MRTMLIAGAAGLMASALPAAAQETTADAPFNGVYVGAAGGYDVQSNDRGSRIFFDRNLDGSFNDGVITAAGANAFSPGFCGGQALGATRLPAGCRKDKDGWNYYGRVGADTQRGSIVVGVVGEFGKSEIRDSVSAFSTTPANYVMTRTVDWEAAIRGRVGYAADTTLFYGAFGPGYARIDRSFTSTNTANLFEQRGRRNQWGITGGGGIEQKLGRNFSIGMEYMFHRYQDDDYRVRAVRGTAPANNPFVLAPNTTGTDFRRSDDKFMWHSIRGTAAFRF